MANASLLLKKLGFGTTVLLSVLIALVSYRFVPQGVEQAMDHMAHNLKGNALALYGHIAVAPIALALMPFQFMSRLRARRPRLHRWMGRGYVAAIIISGLAGFELAFHSTAGPAATLGFAILAVLWLWTTVRAFLFALNRQFARHRVWMLRSAALTFAAVTLRIYLGVSMALGLDFGVAYTVIAWACWVPNALLLEAYILRSGRRGPAEPDLDTRDPNRRTLHGLTANLAKSGQGAQVDG